MEQVKKKKPSPIALAKAEKQVFASPEFEPMIESIVCLACETVCVQSC